MLQIRSEEAPAYLATIDEDAVIKHAMTILEGRMKSRPAFNSPSAVKDYARLQLQGLEHEVFCVMWLTSQHHLIAWDEMFRGTVSQTSVYPREVVKEALKVNAAAVIFVHNHPSGSVEPSRADELLTQTLKSALTLVDVRVLDHLIVSGGQIMSFAERGLL